MTDRDFDLADILTRVRRPGHPGDRPAMTCLHCDTPLDHTAMLCLLCTRALAGRLDRMPALHAALAPYLTPGSRRPEEIRGTGAVHAPLPVREEVLDLRGPGGIVGTLEDWRSAMQADRGWGEPASGGTIEDRVRGAARGLSLNLEWIAAAWPMAGTFAGELRDLERSVLSIVAPPEPTYRVGECPATYDGVRCGAIIRAQHGDTTVTCKWCSASYRPAQWLALAAGIRYAAA